MTNDTTAPDLIERLRFCGKLHPKFGYPENGELFNEAADALEAAQALNERLRREAENHALEARAMKEALEEMSDKQLRRERYRLDALAVEATNNAALAKTEMMRRALRSLAQGDE